MQQVMRMKRLGGTLAWVGVGCGLAVLGWCEPVLAKTIGELGEHVASQGEGMGKAISTGCYLAGMAAGGGCFLKLKANRDSPQQHPLSHALVLALACAGLLYLPQTFKTAGDSIYTQQATPNQVTGTTAIGQ